MYKNTSKVNGERNTDNKDSENEIETRKKRHSLPGNMKTTRNP